MRTAVVSLLLCLLLCISAVAQTPKPASTPPVDDGDVVKITTSLIQLDVSVTDAKGKTVTDLRPDEIEVYENGTRQKVTNFRFVSNLRSSEEFEQRRSEPNAAVLPPSSPVRPERVHRTIALVVDDLSLS